MNRGTFDKTLAGIHCLQENGVPFHALSVLSAESLAMPDELEERAIVGTPADCRRRLAELDRELGLDQVAFYFHAGARDPKRARHNIELFAHEVMPEFQTKR